MDVCRKVIYSGQFRAWGFAMRLTAWPGICHHRLCAEPGIGRGGSGRAGCGREIERFLAALERRMEGYIAAKNAQEQALGKFDGFDIRV